MPTHKNHKKIQRKDRAAHFDANEFAEKLTVTRRSESGHHNIIFSRIAAIARRKIDVVFSRMRLR
ncbi:MAG: hypothetical protein BM485_16730 [Desulfobulbaceae bacterium DB1]|nr:MAG: hypothetical protein BM485_16730 [Desulfobulbaceae bacterium DB1]